MGDAAKKLPNDVLEFPATAYIDVQHRALDALRAVLGPESKQHPDAATLGETDRAVLAHLILSVNKETALCCPGQPKIAAAIGLRSRVAVRRAIARLCARGLVLADSRDGTSPLYGIRIPSDWASSPGQKPTRSPNDPVVSLPLPGRQTTATRSPNDPKLLNNCKPTAKADAEQSDELVLDSGSTLRAKVTGALHRFCARATKDGAWKVKSKPIFKYADQLIEAYPGIDLLSEIELAGDWCEENKKVTTVSTFLRNWLKKAKPSAVPTDDAALDWVAGLKS